MKYEHPDTPPPTEMMQAFLTAALMCGDTFSPVQYREMAKQYAGGYKWFVSITGYVEDAGEFAFRVSEKGLQFLKNGGK
jgi:hypothetical protein